MLLDRTLLTGQFFRRPFYFFSTLFFSCDFFSPSCVVSGNYHLSFERCPTDGEALPLYNGPIKGCNAISPMRNRLLELNFE